uniref:RING-type domain-containing protein n=1 Tax=Gasterosteus aculeatus aculeatus TaxID=481459 RepID=A0AAQ4RKT6_GASAC
MFPAPRSAAAALFHLTTPPDVPPPQQVPDSLPPPTHPSISNMSEDREGRAAAPPPNVKPKLGQTERRSKEGTWKKEKPPKERSEEARGRDGRGSASGRVKPPEDEVEDTECAVCFCSYDNIFRTPKLLACGHTFCLECLARINVTSARLKTLSCPVCREPTELPHGRDLPRLGTNKDVLGRLPPDMRRVLSIRFKRSKGKLQLKNPPPAGRDKNSVRQPSKIQGGAVPAGGHSDLSALEQGVAPTTVVDVGRPPNRVRGRLRRLFRSDRCYYAAVASVITITVVLMLAGVLAFVIIPSLSVNRRPFPGGNQTSDRPPG